MRVAIVLIAVLSAGCGLFGPSDDLSGHWIAQSVGHFQFLGLTLTQSGDVITGTACATSDGIVLYSGVAVSGDYPNLQFSIDSAHTKPCCASLAGSTFKGRRDSTKDIVGTYTTLDVRFKRSEVSLCP